MNLTPLSSAHAYLQLKLYRSSLPSIPARSIHSMKEMKDHRAQCGKKFRANLLKTAVFRKV